MNLQRLQWYARHLSLPLTGPAIGIADNRRTVARGRGITFAGLREYEYGDDVRTIDWNATARFARPFVKTFQDDRAVDLLILLDCSASLGDAKNPSSKIAIARELAAVFVLVALRQEQRISVLLFTDRSEWKMRLDRGRGHVNQLLRALDHHEVLSRRTDLSAALRQVPRLLPHPGFVLLISDFADSNYEEELRAAGRRHDVFALALLDPGEAEPPDVGLVRARDVETGSVEWIDTSSRRTRDAWRTSWLRRQRGRRALFGRAGVVSVDIQMGQPYFSTLKAACRNLPGQRPR